MIYDFHSDRIGGISFNKIQFMRSFGWAQGDIDALLLQLLYYYLIDFA